MTASLNPALVDWTGHEGLPRFEAIRDEDFAPAFDAALARHEAEIDAIAGNPEPPTFENTIVALEKSGPVWTDPERLFSVHWLQAP